MSSHRLTSICYSCNQVVCGSLLLLIAFLRIARVAVLKPTAGELCYSTLLLLRSENAWVCSEPPVECRRLCYSHNSTLITLTQTCEWLFMAVPTYQRWFGIGTNNGPPKSMLSSYKSFSEKLHCEEHSMMSLRCLSPGFVRSWKTWKSHGILKPHFPGLEKFWKNE